MEATPTPPGSLPDKPWGRAGGWDDHSWLTNAARAAQRGNEGRRGGGEGEGGGIEE